MRKTHVIIMDRKLINHRKETQEREHELISLK